MAAHASKVSAGSESKINAVIPSKTISTSRSNVAVRRIHRADVPMRACTGRVSTLLQPRAQAATLISSPSDPAEREAEVTAKKIMRMPLSQSAGVTGQTGGINRAAETASAKPAIGVQANLNPSSLARSVRVHNCATGPQLSTIQCQGAGRSEATPGVVQEIQGSLTSGDPLPADVRSFMEPRFRADFSGVRIHTDDKAGRLSTRLGARAFTFGKHIFFGRGQFRPNDREGAELLAHELTHTIQQREVVQREEDVTIAERSPTHVQRLGISDALNFFAERANLIPGFRMFTIILGVNPINMSRVDRSAANILRALVEFLPGGALITQALDNYGVFDRVGTWVEQQIRTLGMTGSVIRDAINRFLDSLSWSDIFNLSGVWDRARRIFTEPIDRILGFGRGLVDGIIQFVKDAILMPLARLAQGTRGWDLLCAVLGRNPITGEAVPRNADTLIGGFMRLIGQEEVWTNIQRGNAVARAWGWFQGTLAGVLAFVQQFPTLFVQALRSLSVADIVLLPRAFARVATVFGGFALRFLSWAGEQVMGLLTIIFEVVAPQVMVYIRRAAGALRTIIADPIRFIGNLVRAGILGLSQFASNFLTHLRASLIGWLTGAMSGVNIYIPQAFTLLEIVKFILSVLGLTWQNIRAKLVRVIGETAVAALETGFDIVVTLVREGPAAAWERIVESITNLREMVMEQVMTFVRDRIVTAAITRLVTSLNPVGAFIQAIIAIYNTVMFFVERLQQIAQVAAAVIDSISAIASGVITAAANRVEQTMAGLLTLVISFLARIAGLGRVSDAVINIINRVRQPIDRALDRVVAWIVTQARRLGRLVVSGARAAVGRVLEWWRKRTTFRAGSETHTLSFEGNEDNAELTVASTPRRLEAFVAEARTTRALPGERAAIGRIEAQIPAVRNARSELRRLRRANAAESAMQPHVAAMDAAFAVIGTEIGGLLAGADAGKREHPIELQWPKPAWSAYPPLFLYRVGADTTATWRLTAREDGSVRFVKKYLPSGAHQTGDTTRAAPPAELNALGIQPPYRVQTGSTVAPLSDHSTPGGAALNNLLARYGWSASGENMDGDHVQEIQFGGQDVLTNLWPLNASVNRGAGSSLSRQSVQLGTERLTVDTLKRVRLTSQDVSAGKFTFRIRIR